MTQLTYVQHTLPVTSEREGELPKVYHARVDGVINGRAVEFGITNRCHLCKGTGIRKGSKSRCGRCQGLGYIQPSDTCMHECGCGNDADPQLIFVCDTCFDGLCYGPSAFDIT